MPAQPTLDSVYLFVRDMPRSVAFYERLGLTVESAVGTFVRFAMPGGVTLELGTAELTRRYDPGWREPDGLATNTLNFTLASRDAVDDMYATMTAADPSCAHLAPIDAFWRSRFAILADPDGNLVGLHSPREPAP